MSLRVMIIDDETAICVSLGAYLEDNDFAVAAFESAEAALAALDRETGRRVVLKIAAGPGSEETLALRKEFRLLASLDHPSIVKARDFGVTPDGRAWFSTDEVDGPDLAAFAREHAPLENLAALADVAHALAYVHSRGIVHGDVKPQNVRVLGERAVLLDFGLAFARGEDVAGIRGTPQQRTTADTQERYVHATSV